MKIGILTFHRSINYGAYMQSLALSREIQKRFPGHETEVIDYTSLAMEKNYKVKFKPRMLRDPKEFFRKIKRKKVFRRSLKYLPLSPTHIVEDDTQRIFEYIKDRYDVVIVGSDAVWNWIKRGFPNPYLLDIGNGVTKLSYAASAFGMDMKHVSDERRKAFGKSLSEFRYIGVRDGYTDNLVHYCAGDIKTNFNCDPTTFLDIDYVYELLGLDTESYRKMIYKKAGIPADKRIICTMGTNRHLVCKLKAKYRNTHRIVGVFSRTGEEDAFLSDLNPLEWSLLFGLADLTLTNFFHGTLLSIRNSTPVISIDHTGFGAKYKGKLQDALEHMGLEDCFFTLSDAMADDWDSVINKADELLSDKELRSVIDNNRRHMASSNESFFDALAEVLGEENKRAEAPDKIIRDRGFEFTNAIRCTGCMLCAERCPHKAIDIKLVNGFYTPMVDKTKCTECGACMKACPVNKDKKAAEPARVVALCDRNEENRKASSSGGAVGLIAEKIFAAGGVVSGVVYKDMKPVHAIARNINEFAAMRGSKYVQADMGDIYTQLKTELEKGIPVLATGTPCQIAAVKSYFGDKYENLYTLDLICHGVQSPHVFDEYIKSLEAKKGKKVVDFKFRDKTNGWRYSNVLVSFEDGSTLKMTRKECEYFNYFDYLRNSCYRCHFRGYNNYSDVTAGDYWGIESLTDEFNDDKGTSILLTHTEKGEKMLSDIDNAKIVESNIPHAEKTHKKLRSSISTPPPRNKFFKVLGEEGYTKARKYYYNRTRLYRIKVKIKRMIGGK
ncbi:MAG: Coenzyme F420 hydrogenase/dehydrogenase, beta subunit C-terminal domain [Clostridia bacterium]|nr:Coenzyme F420 hydrogenase/dehydrogenase, beta subunit C-terminal domain [Clostridia bacterium]